MTENVEQTNEEAPVNTEAQEPTETPENPMDSMYPSMGKTDSKEEPAKEELAKEEDSKEEPAEEEGSKEEDSKEEGSKEEDSKEDSKEEEYKLEVSEETQEVLDPSLFEEYESFAKEMGVPKEKAAEFADSFVKKQMEVHEQQINAWLEQAKKDPDIGGDKFNQTTENALKPIKKFGDEELESLLSETGLGNHPALIRFANKIGQAMSEAGVASGKPTGGEPNVFDKLYPNFK